MKAWDPEAGKSIRLAVPWCCAGLDEAMGMDFETKAWRWIQARNQDRAGPGRPASDTTCHADDLAGADQLPRQPGKVHADAKPQKVNKAAHQDADQSDFVSRSRAQRRRERKNRTKLKWKYFWDGPRDCAF